MLTHSPKKKKKKVTLRSILASIPGCPDVVLLRMEAAWFEEVRRWDGVNSQHYAVAVLTYRHTVSFV